MADAAVRLSHAHDFGGSEDVLVILDRVRRSLDDQIRRDGVVALGNVVDCGHGDLLGVPRVGAGIFVAPYENTSLRVTQWRRGSETVGYPLPPPPGILESGL